MSEARRNDNVLYGPRRWDMQRLLRDMSRRVNDAEDNEAAALAQRDLAEAECQRAHNARRHWMRQASKYRTRACSWRLLALGLLGLLLAWPIIAELPLARWLPHLFGR